METKNSKLITDKQAFYVRLLELLKEGKFIFINTLTGKVIYFCETFPDNGEVMVDEGFGETNRYLINIIHIDVFRPKSRSVHHIFDDLLKGFAKPVVILLLMMLPMFVKAQVFDFNREVPPNAIYIAYQPWDHGLGLRYDQYIWKMGAYGSVTYGNLGLYKGAGLKNHWKFTAGILIPINDDRMGNQADITLALNRHFVKTFDVDDPYNNYDDTGRIENTPWSFELGMTIKLRRFALGMRTDILRWEPCIDIGIPLSFEMKRKMQHRFNKYNKCTL